MSTQITRPLLLITFLLLASALLMLSTWGTPTAAQSLTETGSPSPSPTSTPQTIRLTLLFPSDEAGQREHFTIRIDDTQVASLNLSSMNFRWTIFDGDQRFDLSNLTQIRTSVQHLAGRDCVQLFLVNPDHDVTLCNQVIPHGVIPSDVFWTAGIVTFSVYQDDTWLTDCPTDGIFRCSVNWPDNAILVTFTPTPTLTTTPTETPPPSLTPEPPSAYVPIETDTGTFWMRRASVNQIEYNAFIDDGYWNDDFWTTEGINWRTRQGDPRRFRDEDRPARVVWFEAEAFCQSEGGRLPTEGEWRAAYGDSIFREQFNLTEWTRTQFVEGASPITYTVLHTEDGEIQRIDSAPSNPLVQPEQPGFRCVLLE